MSKAVPVKHLFAAEVPAGSMNIETTKNGETRVTFTDARVVLKTTLSDGSEVSSNLKKVDVFAHTFEGVSGGS